MIPYITKYMPLKRNYNNKKQNLSKKSNKIIEYKVNANFINTSDEIVDNLETKKTMLYDMQKDIIEGMMLWSRS